MEKENKFPDLILWHTFW